MKKLLYALTGLCLLAGLFTACEKESEKAKSTLKGVVTDKETGNPLSNVTLELQPTGKQAQTAEDGTYVFDNLKAGSYTLKAQKDGYDDYENAEIQLGERQTLTLDIEMKWIPQEPELQENYTETALGINLEMVYVQGGKFEMGATADQHIRLDGYHIGKYEVTQAQWKAVMGKDDLSGFEGEDIPMGKVEWREAREFCKKLSEATGRKYVLPTEAQWEYAARGGNQSQHYKYAGSDDIDEVAWYEDNSNGKKHPVGTKKANELGIYDMSGNVSEWCSDCIYGSNSYEYGNRGGYYSGLAYFCLVSSRHYSSSGVWTSEFGFRVACIAE